MLGAGGVWKHKAAVAQQQEGNGHLFYTLLQQDVGEEVESQIRVDITRTFPDTSSFKARNSEWNINHHNLFRVLRAYAALDPDVGYCQGMNFLASLPLFHMPADQAFWVLHHFLQPSGMNWREYFLPGFPRLRSSLRITDHLLALHLPLLHRHLARNQTEATTFMTQWFLTSFAYNMPPRAVARLWDLLFLHGHDYMFAIVVVVLRREQNTIVGFEGNDLLEHVCAFARAVDVDGDILVEASEMFRRIEGEIEEVRAQSARESEEEDARAEANRAGALAGKKQGVATNPQPKAFRLAPSWLQNLVSGAFWGSRAKPSAPNTEPSRATNSDSKRAVVGEEQGRVVCGSPVVGEGEPPRPAQRASVYPALDDF